MLVEGFITRSVLSMHMVRKATRRNVVKGTAAAGVFGLAGCAEENPNSGDDNSNDDEFPSREITTIVPWGAGGGTDQTVRKLVTEVEGQTDYEFVVENITGASGTVGQKELLNAEPDGHTIGLLSSSLPILSHLGVADFTPMDFAPIFLYNSDPRSLIVHEEDPYGSVEEFIDYAKENPGEIVVGPGGQGNIDHLSASIMQNVLDIEVDIVPYAEGASSAIQAMLGREINATTVGPGDAMSQIQDGPLEVLGIMGQERLDALPDVPTFPELGYELEVSIWRMFVAPPETPDDRIQDLYETLRSGWQTESYQEWMEETGYGTADMGPDELPSYIENQYEEFEEPAKRMDEES